MQENPLTVLRLQIPFDEIHASQIAPAADALIAETTRQLNAIRTQQAPFTYANTLGALEQATEQLEFAATVVGHIESVATTPAWREAYNAVQPKLSAFWSSLAMDEALYNAVRAFSETDEAAALDSTRRRFLDKTLDDFRRQGAALPPGQKPELEKTAVALAERTLTFSQNVLDSTNAFELVVQDESELAGLPESAKQAAKANAEHKGVEGWRFTLQAPSLIPLLTYADNRALREQVWHAYSTRATAAPNDNRPLIGEILRLRKQQARLLGYQDFSDLVTEDRMAKSGARARAFVDDLRERTVAAFERENTELAEFCKTLEGEEFALQPWDIGYYAEKQRKALYDFDEEALRPYFPLERVLSGLFEITQALYGVKIVESPLPTWHPDVRTYALQDSGGQALAMFYVDLFPREDKRGGAWMNALISGVNGAPHLGLFCANVNPPVGNTPALLTHRETETLFHEFGHLLHHCLSRVSVRSLAGTSVAWDFVELPSQIMENWCWEREALDRFAKHHQTGETIPDGLFRKMKRARTYRAANAQMRQLSFATMDLALHRDYQPDRDGDVIAYALQIMRDFSAVPLPDDYAMVAAFGHLFGSPTGYAAGYYSYKWAEVLDADAFTRFKREGITNPSVGTAFRDSILSKGNSEDPAVLYEAFMGRGPQLDALLERTGLIT